MSSLEKEEGQILLAANQFALKLFQPSFKIPYPTPELGHRFTRKIKELLRTEKQLI